MTTYWHPARISDPNFRAIRQTMEIREKELVWLSNKLRDMVFPDKKKKRDATYPGTPYITTSVGVLVRGTFVSVSGITPDMACAIAGEIEERTGCECKKWEQENSNYRSFIYIVYHFEGVRDGWPIKFQLIANGIEGCQIVETKDEQSTFKVVCS